MAVSMSFLIGPESEALASQITEGIWADGYLLRQQHPLHARNCMAAISDILKTHLTW
jgi:hypothetical protein